MPQNNPNRSRSREGYALGLAVLILLTLSGGAVSAWWNKIKWPAAPAPVERPSAFRPPLPPPPPPPLLAPRERPGDPLDRAVRDLRLGDGFARQDAARDLAAMQPVEERRAEVLRALEPCLRDDNLWCRMAGAKAMSVWGPRECVPALLGLLDDGNHAVRWEVLGILGRLKDGRAAEAVVRHLGSDGHAAEAALIAMGPAAEKPVVARLKQEDWVGQLRVCRILKEIGTAESIPALEEAARAQQPVASNAAEALRAIHERSRDKLKEGAAAGEG